MSIKSDGKKPPCLIPAVMRPTKYIKWSYHGHHIYINCINKY